MGGQQGGQLSCPLTPSLTVQRQCSDTSNQAAEPLLRAQHWLSCTIALWVVLTEMTSSEKYYQVRLKESKLYKYIFCFVHEVNVTNAYILFTHYCIATNHDPAMKWLKEFRLELARGLIGDYNSRKRPGCGATPRCTLAIRHVPVKVKKSTKKGVGQCHYCSHKEEIQSGIAAINRDLVGLQHFQLYQGRHCHCL